MASADDDDSLTESSLVQRYEACMILGAVGDSLGYKRGDWEFNEVGKHIHMELKNLGGLAKLIISRDNGFPLSDDSILHIHTAEALLSKWSTLDELCKCFAIEYRKGCQDMYGRSPGVTTLNGVDMINPDIPNGHRIPFNHFGGGCGAAMRACPIGLLYPDEKDVYTLIAVAIESGRMTHNHPTGFLGAVTASLFVSYAIQVRV